ncbi:MAG: hypothetical protein H3C34_25740, partial [Caldilineaceae bacterium]|nr:hypothetical protein [Caldilineaceae bacterium]
ALPLATNTPPAGTPTGIVATLVALSTEQAAATASAGATPSLSPTATATHTPTPVPTPTRACALGLDAQFAAVYDQGRLGCPTSAPATIWAAWESFERGAMLWRSDTNLAYIFFGDGSWSPSNETWSGQPVPSRGEVPPGRYQPERGFGYVWGVRDDVFNRLGWATTPEKGFCATVQSFERGYTLTSVAVASCTAENLYNHVFDADWQPLLIAVDDSGRWQSGRQGAAPLTPVPPGAGGIVTRPPGQGLLVAPRAQALLLDGRFDDWPGAWQPFTAVIQGGDQWSGISDLSGSFQVMWAPAGLYIAVRVTDETLRSGPEGSAMWQGDGLELQFDQALTEDYTNATADADDTQLGLAPDAAFTRVRGHRWLPYAQEARFDPQGAVTTSPGQYSLETIVPWSLLGVDSSTLAPGAAFGFNLSVNDNDGDTPAQQSVLSASPARTAHDIPTEWGTLILGN